ncbi:septal ring lytic transglycosylase RlpA family protein [Cognatiluteimonas profundi]|uniref:septal ring lytic transglycosylase RlpA family protein n=1 Tax=Cognatiluteimonas profundi TaxID=2594501 RepID=UPI00131CF130|nr:septal ring lytic transglycosylase RlpA family protein [Lysobacter profundi]
MKALALAAMALALAACSGGHVKPSAPAVTRVQAPRSVPDTGSVVVRRSPYAPAQEDLSKRGNYTRGGLYAPEIQDSAPDGLADVDSIPEPEVRAEPRSRYGNRSPYQVLGQTYSVIDDPAKYDEVGLASFYGNKFHGRRTSNLEVYDMYAFSAAHKTLPLPSYARVTNLSNGKSVVVRVNDRGPFHAGRIIDLSYAAAVKLGVDRAGTARVEVKGLSAGENAREPYDAVAAASVPTVPASNPATLPPGVHVATGRPAAMSPTRTAIDSLVAHLPIATANASERPPQAGVAPTTSGAPAAAAATTPNPAGERFDMRQDGRTMTADEFDAWMRARSMRVATGKPMRMPAASRPVAATAPAAATRAALPVDVGNAPPTQATAAVVAGGGPGVTYQVASFAARANAEHALTLLTGAGIAGARLLDADANGRKVWRLRVGPVDTAGAQELVARIQGLGFGQPQRVRE